MDKIKHFFKNNYKYILWAICLVVLNIFLTMPLMKFLNRSSNILYIIIVINIILILIYSFILKKFDNLKIEKLYLTIIIPIGLLYLCLFPINTVPDEGMHFSRIYEISSGHLVSEVKDNGLIGQDCDFAIISVVMNSQNYDTIKKNITSRTTNEKVFFAHPFMALYSFVCYIPQTIGVIIAKILNLPILFHAYFARLFNFIFFVFLTYLSIKLLPQKKNILFMICLFPIVIQEAISMAPDAMTNAATMFLISYVLHLRCTEGTIKTKNIVILLLTCIVLSLCKIVYLPLCLLIFLIPKEKFNSKKSKYIILISITLLSVFCNLYWLSISSGFLPKNETGINSSMQLKYIFSNIFNYIIVILKTYYKNAIILIPNMFGRGLGNFSISLSLIYIGILMIIFLVYSFFDNNDDDKIKLKKIEKWFVIVLILGVILLISTSLYLQWTPVGEKIIIGLQGRYFIPLIAVLPIIFDKFKIKKLANANKYIYLFLISMNIYALILIFNKFI